MRYLLLFTLLMSFTSLATPVKIIVNDWSSQRVLSRVFADILTSHGQQSELLEFNTEQQAGALKRGQAHIQLEVWHSDPQMSMRQARQQQHILSMGEHRATGREEWWYPDYVQSLCPGLPDWQALKACGSLFTPKGEAKAIVWGGNWYYHDHQLIRALGLNYQVKKLANSEQLWQKLRQAQAQKQPILIYNWTPNWSHQHFKGQFINFPPYHPDCETQPQWGYDQHITFDCGNPSQVTISKAAWPGLPEQYPCVSQLLKVINFDQQMMIYASSLVQREGKSEQQAAQLWLTRYQQQVQFWVQQTCLKETPQGSRLTAVSK